MSHTAIVRARIEERVHAEAAAVLGQMGMTVSDAVREMLRLVARDKALPFEAWEPNVETIEAIAELDRGEGKKLETIEAMLADLHADD